MTFLALVPKWVWVLLAAIAVGAGVYFYGHSRGVASAAEELGRYKEAARVYDRDMDASYKLRLAVQSALDACNKDKVDAAVEAKKNQDERDAASEKERRRIVAEIERLRAEHNASPLPEVCEDAVREWAKREVEIGAKR